MAIAKTKAKLAKAAQAGSSTEANWHCDEAS